ncbi:MAG: hypothetical protein HKN85_02825 [Gammaproteobacteria bacterium]|nr:hypothetical protein [Gammaproteobacteria bacterium]
MRSLLVLLLLSLAYPAYAMKKCKDADGNWHYGDVAVEECEHSKITTLNDRGFITEEEPAPKTNEELRAEEEELALQEALANQKKAAAEERRRVLSIYETEADIDRQRNNQLNSVQSNIDVHEAYLKGMDARIVRMQSKLEEAVTQESKDSYLSQIEEASTRMENAKTELEALQAQKGEIVKKFAKEKELYIALKNSEEN